MSTPSQTATYQIRIQGHLDARWVEALGIAGMETGADGTTTLHAGTLDQPALHGLLQRIRDLGVPLLSIIRTDAVPLPTSQP